MKHLDDLCIEPHALHIDLTLDTVFVPRIWFPRLRFASDGIVDRGQKTEAIEWGIGPPAHRGLRLRPGGKAERKDMGHRAQGIELKTEVRAPPQA